MRRGATVLVVVVVAAIALAAGFDALRGDSEPEAAQTESAPRATSSEETPEAAAPEEPPFGGTLYFTDESCELQAVELPGQTPVDAPNWDDCRFVLSPDGRRVSGDGSGWDPHTDPLRGRLFESEDGRIQVSTNAGPEGRAFRGEAPAWRPDGTLTYFAHGAVREWPSGDVVVSQRDLLRALRRSSVPGLAGFRRVRVREAAWLGDRHLAAILSVDGPSGSWDVLTSFDDGGVREAYVETPGRFAELRASPAGTYFAARRGQDGMIIAEPGRGEITPPGIAGYRAIAWSPNEQWAAVALGGGVSIFPSGSLRRPELELDLDVHELDWRGEAGPPELTEAGQVRDWLGGVGGTGRLFVTLPGCRLRALRLPDLVWEEEPDVPASCRFTLASDDAPLDEPVSVSPTGELRAICEGDGLRVFDTAGLRARLPGACGPAWMADGTLTFVRNGGLWQGIEDAHQLVSRERVSEIFDRPSALEEIAWVDDDRFWAVVRSGENAIVALITPDGLAFSPSFTARAIEGLRVSATGMVAARTDQGVVLFDSGGRRTMTFPNGRAVAWAPGELVAAVATPTEILFVAPVSREVVSLPLAVRDLEWVVP